MRPVESDDDLRRLHEAGHGLLYNDFAPHGPGGGQYNVLHAAECRWIRASNTNVPKLYFADFDEATEWLLQNRGPEGEGWKRCATCGAGVRPSAPAPGTATTGEAAGGSTPAAAARDELARQRAARETTTAEVAQLRAERNRLRQELTSGRVSGPDPRGLFAPEARGAALPPALTEHLVRLADDAATRPDHVLVECRKLLEGLVTALESSRPRGPTAAPVVRETFARRVDALRDAGVIDERTGRWLLSVWKLGSLAAHPVRVPAGQAPPPEAHALDAWAVLLATLRVLRQHRTVLTCDS